MDFRDTLRGWLSGPVPAAAVAIILLAALLRFYGLALQPFWYDELISMSMGLFEGGLGAIWNVRYYPHPPLYPALNHLLLLALPPTEFVVRFLPALASLLAFPFFYRYVTDTANRRIALVGMLLLALSPFHIFFSQEGRPYTLMFTLALVTVWVLYRALKTNRTSWWVLHFFCILALLYLHFFCWSIVGSEVLFMLIYWRRYRRNLLPFALSLLAAPLSIPPLLNLVRDSQAAGQVLVLNMIPVSIEFVSTWMTLIAGETRYVTQGVRLASAISFGILAVMGAVRLWTIRRQLLVLVFCMIVVPFVFVFMALPALGQIVSPYEEKMFVIILPSALILAASGVDGLCRVPRSYLGKIAGVAIAVLLLGIVLVGNLRSLQAYYTSFEKNADVEVIDYLESQVGPEDIIVSDGFSMAMNLKYHWDSDVTPLMVGWPLTSNGEWTFSTDIRALPEEPVERTVLQEDVLAHPRVWLVALSGFGNPQLVDDLLDLAPVQHTELFGPFTVHMLVPETQSP